MYRQETAPETAESFQGRVALARISHQVSTAAADPGMSTALRSVGFLDVLSSTPAESSRRAPCIHARLRRLATKPGEKCGLVLWFWVEIMEHPRNPLEIDSRPMIKAASARTNTAAAARPWLAGIVCLRTASPRPRHHFTPHIAENRPERYDQCHHKP